MYRYQKRTSFAKLLDFIRQFREYLLKKISADITEFNFSSGCVFAKTFLNQFY
jgi:hypothetical protein